MKTQVEVPGNKVLDLTNVTPSALGQVSHVKIPQYFLSLLSVLSQCSLGVF